jgi:hypothetical protein
VISRGCSIRHQNRSEGDRPDAPPVATIRFSARVSLPESVATGMTVPWHIAH